MAAIEERDRVQGAPEQSVQRRYRWRQLLHPKTTGFGVAEHESISRIVEAWVKYDHSNAPGLAYVELLLGRYQLIEGIYKLQLLEAGSGEDSDDCAYKASLFLGNVRVRGRALVSPALDEWVAERLMAEAAIMEERRRGREERQFARQDPPPPSSETGLGVKGGGGGRRPK